MDNCACCSIEDCNLGVRKLLKISDKYLKDILLEESGGKKQKIGNKLKEQNDDILKHVFSLGDGFQSNNFKMKTFNNLALDKLRKENDQTSNLGMIVVYSN